MTKPLEPPYRGPYRILQRYPKCFKLDLDGRQDTVSLDRLKPAFIESPQNGEIECREEPPAIELLPAFRKTRSGRLVKTPQRYTM